MRRPCRSVFGVDPDAPESHISGPLTPSGRIFTVNGEPTRWKGVSAFKLCDRFCAGQDISDVFRAFRGYNVLRVWSYVTWSGTGWESPPLDGVVRFVQTCREAGYYVEWTSLTDDDGSRIARARAEVSVLRGMDNVVVEAGNEPRTNKKIDVAALRPTLQASGLPFTSGIYEDPREFWGDYLCAHTPRDSEWSRKSHDLQEYWAGGGPATPNDPAHKVPTVADEPIRPDQALAFGDADSVVRDFRVYAAGCSVMGSGATFHYEGGKYGQPPNDFEARCAAAFLEGLNAFPADAPLGGYERPEMFQPGSLRTYVIGNRFMVRVRPSGAAPAGWKQLNADGQLFER